MRHFASTRAPAARPQDPDPDGPVSAVERIACWSVRHRKAAVLGWLAFVAVALVGGQVLGAPGAAQYDPGQAGRAERMLAELRVVSPPAESVLIEAPGAAPARLRAAGLGGSRALGTR
jgi:putative drug exporter of the RND superfamily